MKVLVHAAGRPAELVHFRTSTTVQSMKLFMIIKAAMQT
jgi:hypothetical protein